MRDPNRISRFCNELKSGWLCLPDLRFGQLMSNVIGAYVETTGKDVFFVEDDEFMEFFERYISVCTKT